MGVSKINKFLLWCKEVWRRPADLAKNSQGTMPHLFKNGIMQFFRNHPKKSLRAALSMWLILFALVPLLLIVAYSAYLVNQRMKDELAKRLSAFEQGLDLELNDVEGKLRMGSFDHANDYYFINLIRSKKTTQLEGVIQSIVENYFIIDRISFFGPKGDLLLSVSPKRVTQNPESILPEEPDHLSLTILDRLFEQRQMVIKNTTPGIGISFDCLTTMKLGKKIVGIIKETVLLDRTYLQNTKERTGLDLSLQDRDGNLLVSTLTPDQEKSWVIPKMDQLKMRTATILDESFLTLTKQILDEDEKMAGSLAILVSQSTTEKTLHEIRNIFILICAAIMIIVLFFTSIATRSVLKPIDLLISATKDIEKGKFNTTVALPEMSEVATLVNAFNTMSESLIHTQAQLVHSSKMTSLGQLVAGVAHELNNPIGFTYSNLSHLKDYVTQIKKMIETYEETSKKLTKALQDHIQKTKKDLNIDFILKDTDSIIQSSIEGTQRTKDIVVGLRNFSRLDEAEIKEVDIHEGLESTLKLLSSELKNRITVHKEYGILPKITCYASQINQVFMNLLSNAIQAVIEKEEKLEKEEMGDIWIKTERQNKQIWISIRDSGKGIPPEHIDRIFDPFFTTKKIGKGTGLGLSISYGIIQKHKGEIKVQSEMGKGSTFTIILPI